MELRLIRNATLRLNYGGVDLLFDPYLAARGEGRSYAGSAASPLADLPDAAEAIVAGVDAVLVSHLHSDHFDTVAKNLISRSTPILCRDRDGAAIREAGFDRVLPIEPVLEWNAVSFAATEGRHGPEAVLADLGDVSGFVLTAPGEPTLYLAGDTVWCAAVEDALDRFSPDVVVVHAAGATWNGHGPILMDEDGVRMVLERLPTATVIATHLDCVDHGTVTRASLAAASARWPENLRRRLGIPQDGERQRLGAPR